MTTPQIGAQFQKENNWETFTESCRSENEQLTQEIKEIDLMIEQSQVEVELLTQKNAASSVHLQQIQPQLESMPRVDIRIAYENALDAQQRLFVMRGQLDKLQSDKHQLTRYQTVLKEVLRLLDQGTGSGMRSNQGPSGAAHTVEMMIQSQESERQRLARQMHDGPAQALTNLILQTDIAMRLFDRDQNQAREELENLKVAANSTFIKVRNFISDLRPMMLDDLGLTPTLNRYIENFKEQTGLDARITTSGMDQRFEGYLEVMIFRAVQELLNNVTSHSNATQVKLQIEANVNDIKVSMDDNGNGFDIHAAESGSGMGLKIIRDRVEMLQGNMEVDSVIGQGTRIVFTVPSRGI